MKKNASLARKVALSCRILAKLGLFKETTSHVSARNSRDQMLIRGRGSNETGLLFTKPATFSWPIWKGKAWKERPASNLPMKRAFMVRFIRPAPTLLALCTLTRLQ